MKKVVLMFIPALICGVVFVNAQTEQQRAHATEQRQQVVQRAELNRAQMDLQRAQAAEQRKQAIQRAAEQRKQTEQ